MIWFIIVIVLIVASPYIARWLAGLTQRWLARKFQQRMREAMGIPPEEKPRRESRAERRQREEDERVSRSQRAYARRSAGPQEPLIPKEYAVDVEYTEIREYSERTEIRPEKSGVHVITESQVTDAEYIVVKPGEPSESPADGKSERFKFWKKQ